MKKVHIKEEFWTTFGHVLAIERLDELKINDVIESDSGKHYVVQSIKLSDSAIDNNIAVLVKENNDERL